MARRILVRMIAAASIAVGVAACTSTVGGVGSPASAPGTSAVSTSVETTSVAPSTTSSASSTTSTTSSSTATSSSSSTTAGPTTASSTTASSTTASSTTASSTTASSTTASSTAASSTTKTAPTSGTPADTNDVIGPDGWQTLTLGMSTDDAAALGMFVDTTPPDEGSCTSWEGVGAAAVEAAVISDSLGVAAIIPRPDAVLHTPEGMSVGWTAAQVAAAYPDFDVADAHVPNGALISAPGSSPAAHYRLQFSDAGLLVTFTLELVNQNCYG